MSKIEKGNKITIPDDVLNYLDIGEHKEILIEWSDKKVFLKNSLL